MLHTIQSRYHDIIGRSVADLGVGCGVLSIGASILGCGHCVGIDCDPDALDQTSENLDELEITNVDLVLTDLRDPECCLFMEKSVDTVVMNPPFGTKKNKGIDVAFLQHALKISKRAVYSLHKTSTRQHLLKKAADWGVDVEVLAELHFNLENTYKCHKQKSVDVEVDLIRFSHRKKSASKSAKTKSKSAKSATSASTSSNTST